MFELSKKEFADWRLQFVTSDFDKMGLRYSPMAVTEQGVVFCHHKLQVVLGELLQPEKKGPTVMWSLLKTRHHSRLAFAVE